MMDRLLVVPLKRTKGQKKIAGLFDDGKSQINARYSKGRGKKKKKIN